MIPNLTVLKLVLKQSYAETIMHYISMFTLERGSFMCFNLIFIKNICMYKIK